MTQPNNNQVLQYWRDVLIASNYPAIDLPILNENIIDEATVQAGRVPHSIVARLFSTKFDTTQKTEDAKFQVLIGIKPFLRNSSSLSLKDKPKALLYLPALLDQEGLLTPNITLKPWIARNFLFPSSSDAIIIGSLEDFDKSLNESTLSEESSWREYISFAEKMFASVSQSNLFSYKLPKEFIFEKDVDARIIPLELNVGSNTAILNLYESILNSSPIPLTLDNLIKGHNPKNAVNLQSELGNDLPPTTIQLCLNHTGQMSNRFGLAVSQRQSLLHIMELKHGDILAVQGPPGTGKTTLLHSVIASQWVNAALQGADAQPPVILGASTNNRAVTNILDSFNEGESDQLITQRWLPLPIKEYGLYLPSEDKYKQEEAKKYQCAVRIDKKRESPWEGLPQKIENNFFLEKAKAMYIAKAQKFFSNEEIYEIGEITNLIHMKLKSYQEDLEKIIKKLSSFKSKKEFDDIIQLSQLLNNTKSEIEEQEHEILNKRFIDYKDIYEQENFLQNEIKSLHNPKDIFLKILNLIPFFKKRRFLKAFSYYNSKALFPIENQIGFQENLNTILKEFKEKLRIAQTELKTKLSDNGFKMVDRTFRYQMFHLAGRYWEGRWLQEMDRVLNSDKPIPLGGQSQNIVSQRFQRWAMLTPCFITTLHTAPKIFQFYDGKNKPLLDFIDLLIIDEAGQISPEIGAPTFALAKKALVVGDVHQIEPVASIGSKMDIAKLKLMKFDVEEMQTTGKASSTGNIMAVASYATLATITGAAEKGLFLDEHRRCKDSLISYCNELIYQNKLIPCVGNKPNGVTPIWGFANLTYQPSRIGTSIRNEREAQAIAEWVASRAEEWMRAYNKPLSDIVAIVTPYAAQKSCLKEAFSSYLKPIVGKDVDQITMGTVHSLQGAEKPIVLFSSTVNFENSKTPFFDKTPNMLNVAVSRAKDSFIVFGDMRLFSNGSSPSSLLGKYLFSSQENELTDVMKTEVADAPELILDARLTTHKEHEQALLNAIKLAKYRILITSPYLSIKRLDEELSKSFKDASDRGIQVVIITSSNMNRETSTGLLRGNFVLAKDHLKSLGCTVLDVHQIHNKTIAVDDSWLIDGSYNWLSAVSDANSIYHNRETSQKYTGKDAELHIKKEWQAFGF